MNWEEQALSGLTRSLIPIPTELNEIDWKSGLSSKTDRLAQHLSAFANQDGGGFLVYGVNDDGSLCELSKEDIDNITKTLGNIASNNFNHPIEIEHNVLLYNSVPLLFVYIPQQKERPVSLRGKGLFECYHRSAGTTVKMSSSRVRHLVSISSGVPFELNPALENVTIDNVVELLNYRSVFDLLNKPIPNDKQRIVSFLREYRLCNYKNNNLWDITNMGALLFANNITTFPALSNRAVRVLVYSSNDKQVLEKQHSGRYGYAVGFEGLIGFIMKNTTSTEDRSGALRKSVSQYPVKTIREFVANALIHQDFAIGGMTVLVEIFPNRIVITNPGTPLNDVNRFIDSPPMSRNESLAQMLFLSGICERRGSGVDIAIEELESQRLPPPDIKKGDSYTRVFIYGPKKYSEMTKTEKIRACYQHACILYEKQMFLTNQSLRARFGISKNNISMVSRIIGKHGESGPYRTDKSVPVKTVESVPLKTVESDPL